MPQMKLNTDGELAQAEEAAPLASFKSINETPDTKKTTALSKKEKGDKENDEASEKLLAKEEEAKGVKMSEVKFIAGDQQNGDAKIEIEAAKQVFSGFTKEELMKYANDPFWIRLRWCMFILFWAIWLSMLAGAIAIVIGAPKCAPPPPKTWWEQGPLIDSPEKDFISIENNLPLFQKSSIMGIFIPYTNTDSYEVILQPDEVKSNIYKGLADKAKENGIRLIIDLTANYIKKTSDWFIKSEKQEEPFKDYFIWADSKDINANGEKNAPNNWLSVLNESAWTYSDVRKQFYLHQFASLTPDLNFRNSDVVKEFDKVIKYWTSLGFAGIRLSKIKHLLVDSTFIHESISPGRGIIHTDYAFYKHTRTTNQPGLGDILAHWRAVLRDNTNGEGLLTSNERIESKDVEAYQVNGTLGLPIDIPRSVDLSSAASVNAKALATVVNASLKNPLSSSVDLWPCWQYSPIPKNINSELSIISLLLPGVPSVQLNQITTSENGTLVPNKTYLELLLLREKPSCLYGNVQVTLLAEETVFAYTRRKSGNPGVLVLFNPSSAEVTVDCTVIPDMAVELTVSILSDNYNIDSIIPKSKVPSNALPLSPMSAIVLTYVPTKNA